MKTTLFLFTCFFAGCQTSGEQKAQTLKSNQKSKPAKEARISQESNEKNALSGQWDKGLLDYGAQERSRQSLDLH
jgi:hypothetical protein